MRGNTIAVFEAIQYLQLQPFVEIEISNYKWISRQLVQKTLQTKYDLKLELDTIQRHFKKLSVNGAVEYIKVGAKDCFKVLKKEFKGMIYKKDEIDISYSKNSQKIESIFKFYSKNQNLDIKNEYVNFTLYYENKKNAGKFDGWYSFNFYVSQWKKWCKNIKENKKDMNEFNYDIKFKDIGTKKDFDQFKMYYMGLGTLITNPYLLFKSWVLKSKKFKSFTDILNSKPKEQQNYKWDFRKAKDVSDKLKDWLEFEAKINWQELYYWKDIKQFDIQTKNGTLKLGWQKVMHPDFNKEEILLFKLESEVGNLLKNTDNEIIEVEVLGGKA